MKTGRILIFILMVGCMATIKADSFAPFTENMYLSSKGGYAFVVRRENEKGGNELRGTLFKKDFELPIGMSKFQYRALWHTKIEEENLPAAMYVADSGKWVVQTQLDSDAANLAAVVVYGEQGEMRAKFKLSDIFSKVEISKLPQTTSMTLWGGGHYFSGKEDRFVLRLWKGGDPEKGYRYQTKAIRLSDLTIVPYPLSSKKTK